MYIPYIIIIEIVISIARNKSTEHGKVKQGMSSYGTMQRKWMLYSQSMRSYSANIMPKQFFNPSLHSAKPKLNLSFVNRIGSHLN